MIWAKYFWNFGSIVLTLLGAVHLYLTFFTNKFRPTDTNVESAMKAAKPILSDGLTIWNAWQGFNASHSVGLLFIGLVNLYLMNKYPNVFAADHCYFLFNIFIVGVYVFLAYKYWFNIPLYGVLTAFACFVVSYGLGLLYR